MDKLAGIYILCLDKKFMYIGESSNVLKRLRVHQIGWHARTRAFDEILFLPEEDKTKRMQAERWLIKVCQPSVNLTRKCKMRRIFYTELIATLKDLQSLNYKDLLNQ